MIIVFTLGAASMRLYKYRTMDYSEAKRTTQKFLNKHQGDLEKIALQILSGKTEEAEYKGVRYISEHVDYTRTVEFFIDCQGMLGVQYWSLIYSEDGTYEGEAERYTYYEPGGNNVIFAEHLQGNWFFYWIDYDGDERLSVLP